MAAGPAERRDDSFGSDELAGNVAIVTGAARGIGRVIAETPGQRGGRVLVNYASNTDSALQVVQCIRTAEARPKAWNCA